MKARLVPPIAAICLCALTLFLDKKAQGQDEVKIDRKHLRELKAKFVTYGANSKQNLIQQGANLRVKLAAGAPRSGQTGISSKFVLSGDCEATCAYQLIDFPEVKTGYGSSIGLAFDGPQENSWGAIQRTFHPQRGNCYVFMTLLPGDDGKMKTQLKSVPTKATKGKIGLKRVGNELIFLTADGPKADLGEAHRFAFPDGSVREVRLYADPGGSPTALEAIFSEIAIRAEEITGGIPRKEQPGINWQWPAIVAVIVLSGSLLVYRLKRRNAGE